MRVVARSRLGRDVARDPQSWARAPRVLRRYRHVRVRGRNAGREDADQDGGQRSERQDAGGENRSSSGQPGAPAARPLARLFRLPSDVPLGHGLAFHGAPHTPVDSPFSESRVGTGTPVSPSPIRGRSRLSRGLGTTRTGSKHECTLAVRETLSTLPADGSTEFPGTGGLRRTGGSSCRGRLGPTLCSSIPHCVTT